MINGKVSCELGKGKCRATCLREYLFPNKQSTLWLHCIDSEWVIENTTRTQIPSCERNFIEIYSEIQGKNNAYHNVNKVQNQVIYEWIFNLIHIMWYALFSPYIDSLTILAVCNSTCQNNGICIKPDVCQCPENFTGPQCQTEKHICMTTPETKNMRKGCSPSLCTFTCMKGYVFSDPSLTTFNMECKNGDWVSLHSGYAKPPECKRKRSNLMSSIVVIHIFI